MLALKAPAARQRQVFAELTLMPTVNRLCAQRLRSGRVRRPIAAYRAMANRQPGDLQGGDRISTQDERRTLSSCMISRGKRVRLKGRRLVIADTRALRAHCQSRIARQSWLAACRPSNPRHPNMGYMCSHAAPVRSLRASKA